MQELNMMEVEQVGGGLILELLLAVAFYLYVKESGIAN